MQFKGTVHRYGRDVDTDVIIPARYLTTSEPSELAKHCMEDLDADFVNKVKQGDIIVADENFGCGSSREHAPIAIKASRCRYCEKLCAYFLSQFYQHRPCYSRVS